MPGSLYEGKNELEILLEHERLIGDNKSEIVLIKGELQGVKNQVDGFSSQVNAMTRSFEDLRNSVLKSSEQTMSFLQGVVKHEQSVEKAKMEFEQKIESLKMEAREREMIETAARAKREADAKLAQEEFERQTVIENREATKKTLKTFAAWFAPTVTIAVALLNDWLQGILSNL